MRNEVIVSAVVFRSASANGRWVAQCIEHDICVSAATLDELSIRLQRQLVSEIANNHRKGRVGLDGIEPAPLRFREMFEASHTELTHINGLVQNQHSIPAKVVPALRVYEAA